MKVVLRIVQYVVALALFAAGALLVGVHVGAVLKGAPPAAEGMGMPAMALDLLKKALASTPESPVWHIVPGLLLAALGLIVARPPVRIKLATKKPPEKQKSLRTVVHELTAPEVPVRLAAAKTLTRLAKPSTIPALIKALLDKTTEVRGQACEALEGMTGLTFDFLDIAPEAVRKESVRQWLAWWQSNKAAILAGADPKTVGGGQPSGTEAGSGDQTAGVSRGTPQIGENEAIRDPTPSPGSVATVGRRTPVPGGVGRQTPAPGGGRNLSVGELLRRKRVREGTPLPGAMAAVEKPADTGPGAAVEDKAPETAEPQATAPAVISADTDAAAPPPPEDGGDSEDFLPSPDDDLPPPE